MAKGVTKPKVQQRSIASFFTSPPPKRKAPDANAAAAQTTAGDDKHDAASDDKDVKPAAAKKSKVALPVKQTFVAKKDTEDNEQDASDEPERAAEPDESDDVEMHTPAAAASDNEDNDGDEAGQPVPTAAKPGRRRLRQRVAVSDDDDDDDVDFALASKKPQRATTEDAPIAIDLDGDDDGDEDVVAVASPAKHSTAPASDEVPTTTPVKAKTESTTPVEATPVKATPVKTVKAETATSEMATPAEMVKVEETKTVTPVKATSVKTAKVETETPVKIAKAETTTTTVVLAVKTETKSAGASSSSSFFAPRTESSPKTSTKRADATAAAAVAADTDASQSSTIAYASLAHLFNTIEATSSRLAIQELLLQFFRDVIRRAPQDLLACIYLCVCTDLAPPFENLKIGIGDAILMKAIGEATGTNMKFIKEMYQKEGDLGKVAQNARSKQHTLSFASTAPANASAPPTLGVQDVYQQFVKIAKMTGNNSQQQKCSIIKSLLVKCEKDRKRNDAAQHSAAEGAKYIIRGLQGKLRIGLAEKSILIGLTYAFMRKKDTGDKDKQLAALTSVKKAFAECPSYNALVAAFEDVQRESESAPLLSVADFAKVADRCVLTPGTPVSPMLARPTKAYAMVFDRFQGMPFTCEYKYDGERAQIHILANGDIAIFSRNFENSTERFPDVKLAIAKAAKTHNVTSCIVDAEVVAVDEATNKRLPFQILSTRSRKNVKIEDIKVPVCIYAFDLLFLDGESYLTKPLAERRRKLQDVFELKPGAFELATSIDIEPPEGIKDDVEAMEVAVDTVRTFLEEAVRENCEGLMVKTLQKEATYEPANRSHKWLKLKKDYLDGIGDSTDLVPIGAFHGRGKRTGVYGAYLLACYDPDTEMYQPITKLGTGLSDEVLKLFYEQLKEKVVDKPPRDYATSDAIKPDVWFEPTCVWEILGADLSISPKYTAGMGLVAKDKGISLRFPRFIRIRDDKNTTDATTSTQIADLYRAQGLATVSGAGDDDDDDMLI